MQNTDSRKNFSTTGRRRIAARAVLAVTLVLTLAAGSIIRPAAASGPTCSLSCCSGREPHDAGSCMEGSCEAGISKRPLDSNGPNHSHHQLQQPAHESDSSLPRAFAGITASAGGADMHASNHETPTVEASTYDTADDTPPEHAGQTNSSDATSAGFALSTVAMSKPCPSDCGLLASSFGAGKRSRALAVLPGRHGNHPPQSVKLSIHSQSPKFALYIFCRRCAPRGPPLTPRPLA